MKRNLNLLVIGLLLVAGLGTAQVVLRGGGAPPAEEIVEWEDFHDLGEPPWDGPVLLEFSADWCVPCRRLKVTVFRDPAFVESLKRHGLRPVRLEYDPREALEWDRVAGRYNVDGFPAMVVFAPDGRFARPIQGVMTVEEFDVRFEKASAALANRLFFNQPGSEPATDPNRLTLRHFDTFWYLDRSDRTDWRDNPTAPFSAWVGNHIDLVGDDFQNRFPLGYEYYNSRGVRTVPTLILEDFRGQELMRFEGLTQIEVAPAEIARIARELGMDVPDPPMPYAQIERQ